VMAAVEEMAAGTAVEMVAAVIERQV
jgi:hypothetical protein